MNIQDIDKAFQRFFRQLQSDLRTDCCPRLKKDIITELANGRTPVKGAKDIKRVPYSASYRRQILTGRVRRFGKRLTPVNLRLSGKMYDSLECRSRGLSLFVRFRDSKAEDHNRGRGKLPVRRNLPFSNEEFNDRINKNLKRCLQRTVRKVFG